MKIDRQLQLWLEGKSVHNGTRKECCPDFSCCRPKLLAPKKVRERFVKATLEGDDKTVTKMLAAFLGKLIDNEGHKTYIIGKVGRK